MRPRTFLRSSLRLHFRKRAEFGFAKAKFAYGGFNTKLPVLGDKESGRTRFSALNQQSGIRRILEFSRKKTAVGGRWTERPRAQMAPKQPHGGATRSANAPSDIGKQGLMFRIEKIGCVLAVARHHLHVFDSQSRHVGIGKRPYQHASNFDALLFGFDESLTDLCDQFQSQLDRVRRAIGTPPYVQRRIVQSILLGKLFLHLSLNVTLHSACPPLSTWLRRLLGIWKTS